MGSANILLILILALGSPSGQCHMAFIGTLAPLILPRTMAQIYIHCTVHNSLPLWNQLTVAIGSHTQPHSHTPSGMSRVDCRSQMDQMCSAPERSEFKHSAV